MEKIVVVPQRVDDLYGLLLDLRKAGFAVRNAGTEAEATYVYLEQEEEKDPTPIVESWVGKPIPILTVHDFEIRNRDEEELASRELVPASVDEGEPPKEKVSFVKKFFRKLWP